MALFNFQKPDKVIMIESSEFEDKFEFRPLEPGYGLTIGNALRRVMHSSLEGYAITSVKIDYHRIYRQMFQKVLYCLSIPQYFSELYTG